jgi:hypothetical protein
MVLKQGKQQQEQEGVVMTEQATQTIATGTRTSQSMDDAAIEAQNDLLTLDQDALAKVTVWAKKWDPICGHKRIGRILVKE